MDVDKATATQLANIEQPTGKTLAQLAGIIETSGLQKHSEIVNMLKRDLGMGHGYANTLAHVVRSAAQPPAASGDVLDATLYGPKQHLRPTHEAIMKAVEEFGSGGSRRG